MCLMCVEVAKERMTISEARRALPELVSTAKTEEEKAHFEELQKASDEELEALARKTSEENP